MEERLIQITTRKQKRPKDGAFKSWHKIWKKKGTPEKVVLIVMFVIFIIYALSLLYPLIWTLYNSFKTGVEFDTNSFDLPHHWTFENYIEVFKNADTSNVNIIESIFNSIWQSTISTLLGIFASSLTAYVCAKYRFRFSGLIYTIAIFIQVIPLVGSVTGMYQLLWTDLGIADEPLFIWPIWFGGFGFSFLMLYGAFKSVPWSFAESAFIDGAGHFTTFLRIMLPAIKPVLASLFIVNFISAWGDYMTAYLYMPGYPPLALAVYLLGDDATRIAYPVYLAVITFSVIPPLVLFSSFQKLIMENTTAGGLKG